MQKHVPVLRLRRLCEYMIKASKVGLCYVIKLIYHYYHDLKAALLMILVLFWKVYRKKIVYNFIKHVNKIITIYFSFIGSIFSFFLM